jgi:hypothetical protein
VFQPEFGSVQNVLQKKERVMVSGWK